MRLSAAEGERRHNAIREWSANNDFAGYVVFSALNFVYATNFLLDVEIWERPVAAIFPVDGSPILIMNELSINHVRVSTERESIWMDPDSIKFYIEHPRITNRTYTRPEWGRMLAELLERSGLGKGRIAVDGAGAVPVDTRSQLPDVAFQARPEILRDLRVVKSEEELDIIRAGAEITDWGMGELKSVLAPGESAWEACLETQKRIARKLGSLYPDEAFSLRVTANTGVDTACPHSPGGYAGRQVQAGDSIICNVILTSNGYVTEDERTFIVGEPTDQQIHFMDAMTRAQQAAIDAMVVGNCIAEIDGAAQRVHEDSGTSEYLFHRTGHGIGLGGHEYPDDTAYNYRPLQAGMVFSAEPAVFVWGLGGFRHSDTVIVGETVPETVTRYSKQLEDLIIHV